MKHSPSTTSRSPSAIAVTLATGLCLSVAHADSPPGAPRASDDGWARLAAFCSEIGERPESLPIGDVHRPGQPDGALRTTGAIWLFNAYSTGELDAVEGFGDLFTYRLSGAERLATGELYSRSAAQQALAIAIWALESGSALRGDPAIVAGAGILDLASLLRDSALALSAVAPVSPRGAQFSPRGAQSTAMTHTMGSEIIAIPIPHGAALAIAGCGLIAATRRRPQRAPHALG